MALLALSGCSRSKRTKAQEAPHTLERPKAERSAKIADSDEPAPSEEDADLAFDEELELDWKESPFQADLDGDGRPESIRYRCEPKLEVVVASSQATAPLGISELVGCQAAIVRLNPGSSRRQLLVVADEHEEAGPDSYFLYGYLGGVLAPVWFGSAEIVFFPDGRWVATEGECDDVSNQYRTTTTTMTWSGAKVVKSAKVSTEAVEAGSCDDP